MGDLAAAEHYRNLDLVATFEELADDARLEIDVMDADLRLEAHFAQYDLLLVLVRLSLFLRLLVLELAVIKDAADRGVRVRRDLDEIEACVARHFERLLDGDDADLLPLVIDDQDFADADTIIDAELAGYDAPLEAERGW